MNFNDFSNNNPLCNFGDIVVINSGVNVPNTPNGKYYNLTMGSVTKNGKLVFSLKTNETNRLLCKGQLIMPNRDVGDCSIIGRTALIDESNKYFSGNCLYVLTLKKGNPTYLHLYMNSNFARKQISKIIEGGSQKQITLKEIEKIQIPFPNIKKQDKIAKLFNIFEKEIEKEEYLIQKLKNIKQSFLESLFPTETNNIPKLRFGNFTDTWEQRKLKDIGYTYTGLSGKSKEDFGHGKGKFITYMNVYSNSISDIDMVEPIEIDNRQNEICYGDVFFTTSSETPNEVGMSSVLLEQCKDTYLNSFCFGFRPTTTLDYKYLAYVLRSPFIRQKIILLAQGISRYNISKNKLIEIELPLPSLEEQKKIGEYFYNIDTTITLHQRKPFHLNFSL